MSQQTLEILLKAKNLTEEAFRSVQKQIEDVEGSAKKSKTGLAGIRDAVDGFAKGQADNFKAIGQGLGLLATGTVAAGAAIMTLGVRGSTVKGVKDSFDRLAASVGDTGESILKVTGKATKGLISDMDIMASVNKGILLGLPLTSGEMGTLAQTAIVLGKAMKVGPNQAMDDLITGLGRGSPLILDNLGITIDSAKAYEEYGRSIGKSGDKLTDAEKKLAVYRSATVAAAAKVEELGGLHLSFADRVQIGRVSLENFIDKLSLAVATSPAVNRALEVIGESVLGAFGGESQGMIERLVGWINSFATGLVTAAQVAVSGGKLMVQVWDLAKIGISGLMTAIFALAEGVNKAFASILEAATKIPGVGDKFQGAAWQIRDMANATEGMRKSFQAQTGEAVDAAGAHMVAFDAASAGLGRLKAEMERAIVTGQKYTAGTENGTRSTKKGAAATAEASEATKEYEKKLAALLPALADASRNQASIDAIAAQYGTTIFEVVRLAEMQGRAVPASIAAIASSINRAKLAELWKETWKEIAAVTRDQVAKVTATVQEGLRLQAEAHEDRILAALGAETAYGQKLTEINQSAIQNRLDAIDREREAALAKLGEAPAGLEALWGRSAANIEAYFKRLKADAVDQSSAMAAAFVGVAERIAGAVGGAFGSVLSSAAGLVQTLVHLSKDKFSGLAGFFNSKTGKAIVGGVGIGLDGFAGGFSAGATGGRLKGAIVGGASGALSGAATGAMIGAAGGPIGMGAGALIGLGAGILGGIFGGNKKKKEEEAALKDAQKQLEASFGGLANLKKVAAEVGVNIDRAFSTKSPKEFEAIVGRLNTALEDQKKRLEGIAVATDGLNLRAEAFGLSTAKTQEGFARLGLYATAVFAAQVKETGSVIGALQAIDPTLEILAASQKALGFEASATVGKLLGMRETVIANEDVATSLEGLNQLMRGLGDAGLITAELFEAFGQDAAAQFAELEARGVASNEALVLMQPTLQTLWEQQKRFGGVTDEATAALLRQAEEQGLVGASMQSVNERMLDVLLAIGEALGATLPGAVQTFEATSRRAFGGVESAARDAAAGVESSFAGIRVPEIDVPYRLKPQGGEPGDEGAVPGAAVGMAVPFTPGGRVVRVAERETERIVSDAQLGAIIARAGGFGGGGGGSQTIILRNVVAGREMEDVIIQTTNEGLANRRIRVPNGVSVERIG